MTVNKKSRPVMRAIDVGYGNTKYTMNDGVDGEMVCKMFPSIAPRTAKNSLHGLLGNHESCTIQVDGVSYDVGEDAHLAMTSGYGRSLEADFWKKSTYMALVRGALRYMNVDRVDTLAMGLPVSTFRAHAAELKKLMTGTHDIGGGKSVEVARVIVIPQPVGGMLDYGMRNGQLRGLEKANNLLIDPGYGTLDFLFTSGPKLVGQRSDAIANAGMAAYLQAVGESLAQAKRSDGKQLELTEAVLGRIDVAVRTNEPLRISGKIESLETHMAAGQRVIEDGLSRMNTVLGDHQDIDNVIIVGGAAHIYKDAVAKLFASHDVRCAADPCFANVRGFQLKAVQEWIQSESMSAAASAKV